MFDSRKINIAGGGLLALALVAIVFGFTQLSSGSEPVTASGGTPQNVDPEAVSLFQANCAQCHTLAVAGAKGQVGPVLDDLSYKPDRVLKAIRLGGRGSGAMPAGLLSGTQAQRVAKLVASQ